ncbi:MULTISPECIES: LacI family DNA-binding transcriptional regulator [Paenibacillus]|uniref:LacI family DNA-binding transcriptional regulator n=1 Tax=Paenibacillus xylanilyticus TaxID=248903 RepID=A0A7Y6BX31_9BACL|nr:LacI family DNA-binding transcriptional regulator [Paenibacillus xylanilyticus]NUU76500.1 LacI family DNA-binding transcriptional regulator [Paenibacillus xylanilyticus]
MGKKVTMQQIADAAGVSKFAVSRALTGKPGVSEQTRDMIVRTAGQLGYFKAEPKRYSVEPQPERVNKQSHTGTILILFPNIRSQNRSSLYWGPVFDGISARLNEQGMDILTLTEPSSDRMFSVLNPEAISGIITVGSISTPILLEIYRLQIPLVMVDHEDPAIHGDTVFTDNMKCMKELVLMLVGKGYRRFQFAGQLPDAASFRERWLGYRSVLEEMQLLGTQQAELLGPDLRLIQKAIIEMPIADIPEVIVCANDHTAVNVLRALQNRGVSVPERCAVTGFDNTSMDEPILATVHINKENLGIRAVDQLLWRMDHPDEPYERKLIYSELVVRDEYNAVREQLEGE